jgi:hypothetical protein
MQGLCLRIELVGLGGKGGRGIRGIEPSATATGTGPFKGSADALSLALQLST